MKITINNPNTGEERTVKVDDTFKTLSEADQQKTVDEIYSELNWKSLETLVWEKEREHTQKQQEQIDDISPFYLYSPLYIPFFVLLIFVILIIKKKIKTGWSRIGACLSIMWALFWGLYILLQTPVSAYSYSYNSAIGKIIDNLLLSVLSCLMPFVLFFIIYKSVKWILEGFKANKNQLN